ncbi:chemotaxis protein CheB [Allocoleopsis franciscana]|uniref:protein-glutamate methylesterase n=1 Tax=Allocoleopsis franciscana PCC 7113 TaxID=1173027 RepID=K9WG42_9CYAN|nr:chemotaxis protein CheB [Allocoleopsis franciscana]AFZ18492.1 chemotaxis response regulator containing a CheY-like receiver domain and a methylesterase domain [Allocoleopsis franciscana PCC 7113]
MATNKVVLIEDSPVALEILQRLLNSSPDVDVVGVARDGAEGLEVITKTKPDVICTDFMMENMDGLELTKRVMADDPRPILVISNFVQKTDVDNVFRLLQAGAADVFPKPTTDSPTDYERLKSSLVAKIKVLSSMKVTARRSQQPLSGSVKPITSGAFSGTQPLMRNVSSRVKVIAIGASTGGLQSIQKILGQLPSNFPLPIICTVHVSTGVLSGLVNWLSSECPLKVKIAEVGETPAPGTVYFAPEKCDLEVDFRGKFIYSNCPVENKHCPSINVAFKSLAQFYGKAMAGVLLTGLGRDGAEGLQAIVQAGGITVAQDEKGGGAFGMVKEAITMEAVQQVLTIEKIAPFLLKTLSE